MVEAVKAHEVWRDGKELLPVRSGRISCTECLRASVRPAFIKRAPPALAAISPALRCRSRLSACPKQAQGSSAAIIYIRIVCLIGCKGTKKTAALWSPAKFCNKKRASPNYIEQIPSYLGLYRATSRCHARHPAISGQNRPKKAQNGPQM